MSIRKFLVLVAVILILPLQAKAVLNPLQIVKLANKSCIRYKVKGICIKHKHGHIEIGIKISMWKPVLLIETVKKPFDSNLPLVGKFGSMITKKLSSGSIRGSGDEYLQFNDVHIMSFPFSSFMDLVGDVVPMWCGGLEAPFPTLYYLSELDFMNWRQFADMFTVHGPISQIASFFGICDLLNFKNIVGMEQKSKKGKTNHQSTGKIGTSLNKIETSLHLDKLIKKLKKLSSKLHLGNLCMGDWGATYPRRGFIRNQSEVVGSAADAFRAASWDSEKTQVIVRFLPLPFTPSTDDELQMALPYKSKCIKIGENPSLWENGKLSPNGKYLWIYWKHFTCCKF